MANNEHIMNRKTAERLPFRVLTFLRTVSLVPEIRAILWAGGYTQRDHDDGWEKLESVLGRRLEPASSTGAVKDAFDTLERENGHLLQRAAAGLRRLHPAQAAFVLDGLEPTTGHEAVVTIATFLRRLDELEHAPEREATRHEDHAALATLALRGITQEQRDRLAALVATTRTVSDPQPVEADDRRGRDLADLHAWFADWSDTARALVARRDHRIRLGIAKRKAAQQADEVAAPAVTPPPAAPPALSPPPPVSVPTVFPAPFGDGPGG